MNYYKLPTNKFEFPSNLLISTPASSATIKLASMRHEKTASLLKLPPIKSLKTILPSTRRNDPSTLLMEKFKNIKDSKDQNNLPRDSHNFSSSPLKRILLSNKNGIKENRLIDAHQRNLKDSNGLFSDFSNEFKMMKSQFHEKTNNLNHEQLKTPKSEQTLPKMYGKRFEGIPELKIEGITTQTNDTQKNRNNILASIKHRENFQIFFNPSMLLSDQLLKKDDLPRFEPSKCSSKKNGVIKAYSANTHQGLIRNYNEDRVAIILNIIKPANKKIQDWPSCSFFAIYDGHGGSKCADFLRDHLHHYIVKDALFPLNPKIAIKRGLQLAEKNFLEQAQQKKDGLEKSGSCAIILMIINDVCYIANVGDSRAILSSERGNKIIPLSLDHKPGLDLESKRILEAGGQIYQSSHTTTNETINGTQKVLTGPFRVLPGRLSVSRTFGDAEAKLEEYGGNHKVVIAEPDIKSFKISNKNDFILLGCDGIFDKLNNIQVIQSMWETLLLNKECKNLHEFSGRAVENLMKEVLVHKSLDNVTAVMICFKNFQRTIFPKKNKNIAIERQGSILLKKLQLIEINYVPEDFNEKCCLEAESNNQE